MAAVALSRVGLRRVESPAGRGIVPGAGDAPRARAVRARGGAPSGVSEGGDVWDVREATLARHHPANVGSARRESDDSATLTDPDSRARRVGLHAHPPDPWIRVVVDSVLLDYAPFEPPGDAASARASENFRSAGGEPRETVRVLTAVLRTVTDGQDRLFPLVASALVEPLGGGIEPEPEGARVHEDENHEHNERRERENRSVKDGLRRPYVFAAPRRAPRPTSFAPPSNRTGDRSVTSRASYASRRWPPTPAPLRHDPLEMCFEYLENCMRPAKKKRAPRLEKTNERAEFADAASFTAYGGDRSGSGMHQDVDRFFDAGVFEPQEPKSEKRPENSLEDTRSHLERCAAEDAQGRGPPASVSAVADLLSPSDAFVAVEPRDVDDLVDALEDRVEFAYLVLDASATGAARGGYRGTVSASAQIAATVYATPRDFAKRFEEVPSDVHSEGSGTSSETSDDASPRAVRFETGDWLESGRDGAHHHGGGSGSSGYESHIVGLESFLALCAAQKRNVPMYVSRDVADAAGVAPDAWRPSFRSARRLSDYPVRTRREANDFSGGVFLGRHRRSKFEEYDAERRNDFFYDENAIGDFVTRTFDAFLRGVAEIVAENRENADFRRDAEIEPPNSSSRSQIEKDLGEALLGGPVVFFRVAARAWAEWYRKHTRIRSVNTLAGEGFASLRGDSFSFSGRRVRNEHEGPPGTTPHSALRLLTGKRGDLASNALLRSKGRVGTVTSLDRRSLDCVAAHRMTLAAATLRKRFLNDVVDSSAPNHVAASTLLLDAFKNADPEVKTLVKSWAQRVASVASDADAYAELERSLDETVAVSAAEVDECFRKATDARADGGGKISSPGRAIASLELAVAEDRWEDAARWRAALRRVNGRCADHEAVFGAEPGEDGYEA